MKKSALLLFAIILASCQKEFPSALSEREEFAEVSFSIWDPSLNTKGGPYTDEFSFERNINSVSYFVFNSSGLLEAFATCSGTSPFSRTVPVGNKTFYALVNIDPSRFKGVLTLSALEALETSFSDMTREKFTMSGKVTKTITAGNNTVSIPVERYVSRIYIAQIANSLEGNLSGEDIEIRNIYVTNVVGNCLINGSFPSVPVWYNMFGREDGAESKTAYITCCDDSLLGTLAVSEENRYLSWDDVYEACTPLYFFPNNATSDVNGWSSTFTKRYTRVVVEAYIRGQLYFYPVNIIGAKRNKSYTLYLNITRPGSLDPDTFVWSEIQDVTVTVGGFDEWEDEFIITY